MKTIVIDTNVYLTDVRALYSFGQHNIAIPTIVLDEIDKHKHRQDTAGLNARTMNRVLDSLRAKGSLFVGVQIDDNLGKVFAAQYDPRYMPVGMNSEDSDNKIICTALRLKMEGREVVVVSRDVNMRVKCDAFGVVAYDYQPAQVVESVDRLYSGKVTLEVPPETIDKFYQQGEVEAPEGVKLYPNQFVTLKAHDDESKSAITRYMDEHTPLQKINTYKRIWGMSPRNTEQKFAMDLLFDRNVDIISLTGKAGTGKTLIAAACGLEQVINSTTAKGGYDRLIVTRPVQPMGRDIGFLPGTLEEKMMPWLAPIRDNLEFLMGGDKDTLDMYLERGLIEIEALTYIRGRSIANAFIIIDEAQNLTSHELKTIITRVGEGTKIVLTGDIEQIDNAYIDQTSNGLTYAVEKFKSYDLSGHVTLKRGERSKVASLAAKIL